MILTGRQYVISAGNGDKSVLREGVFARVESGRLVWLERSDRPGRIRPGQTMPERSAS